MARNYAGTLGYLAMAVTLLRGAMHGAALDGTVTQALIAMVIMAAVGAIVGGVAERTIDESIRLSLEQRLAERSESGAASV